MFFVKNFPVEGVGSFMDEKNHLAERKKFPLPKTNGWRAPEWWALENSGVYILPKNWHFESWTCSFQTATPACYSNEGKEQLETSSRWWFQRFFFQPENLGRWSNLTNIFSDWLIQPPTRKLTPSHPTIASWEGGGIQSYIFKWVGSTTN